MRPKTKHPQLYDHVLEAITNLAEVRGSSVKTISDAVKSIINEKNVRPRPRNLSTIIRKSLQHGVQNGSLHRRAGRYKLQPRATASASAAARKNKRLRPPRRNRTRKQPLPFSPGDGEGSGSGGKTPTPHLPAKKRTRKSAPAKKAYRQRTPPTLRSRRKATPHHKAGADNKWAHSSPFAVNSLNSADDAVGAQNAGVSLGEYAARSPEDNPEPLIERQESDDDLTPDNRELMAAAETIGKLSAEGAVDRNKSEDDEDDDDNQE